MEASLGNTVSTVGSLEPKHTSNPKPYTQNSKPSQGLVDFLSPLAWALSLSSKDVSGLGCEGGTS